MEIEIRMETSPGKASKAAKPTGKVSFLEGSMIHCPTVIITAHKVVISDTSEISTNGTSHTQEGNVEGGGGLWSAPQRGASHGGLGGTASGCTEDAQLTRRLALVHGDPFAPWQLGRAAGAPNKRGAGGGRIRISATFIELNGTLSASGTAPEESDDDENSADWACGSGGSIWISSQDINQPVSNPQSSSLDNTGEVDFVDELGPGASTVQKGRILAMGGCCRKCLCGGGGRVLTEAPNPPRNVITAGGCFRDVMKMDGEGCRCGSAGTWAFSPFKGLEGNSRLYQSGTRQTPWQCHPEVEVLEVAEDLAFWTKSSSCTDPNQCDSHVAAGGQLLRRQLGGSQVAATHAAAELQLPRGVAGQRCLGGAIGAGCQLDALQSHHVVGPNRLHTKTLGSWAFVIELHQKQRWSRTGLLIHLAGP